MSLKTVAIFASVVLLAVALGIFGSVTKPIARSTYDEAEFVGFPMNEPQIVDFEVDPDTLTAGWREAGDPLKNGTIMPRDLLDQYRDWLLVSIVQSLNLPVDELNKSLFDVPMVRDDHLRRVATIQTGDHRSALFGEGEVVALVPAGEGPEMFDNLASIADEQRKNLGGIPSRFHVFEYKLNPDEQFGTVTRRAALEGGALFTDEHGYYEMSVPTLSELQRFMNRIDDLTYASKKDGFLVLGGRRLRREYRGIRPLDVATIWKSESSIEGQKRGSGFSLDPQMDFEALEKFFAKNLESWGALQFFGFTAISDARAAVANKDESAFIQALTTGCEEQGRKRCREIVREVVWENLVQAARYDGRLQGTEVGMVLFYTDLLMKLWAQDFENSTPDTVEGFPNRTYMLIPVAYRKELEELSETRLWLGSLDSGFQITSDRDEISYARIATRIYAVPHDYTANADHATEIEPNYPNRILMTWWNDHYEEVARYEPEYERLNEIMKWSQLVGWLSTSGGENLLSFLDRLPDEEPKRFPSWVEENPNLTFKRWSAIGFHRPGRADIETESMPILQSPDGRILFWRGGVSLARRAEIAERATVSRNVSPALRRGTVDFSRTNAYSDTLTTLNKTEYSFPKTFGNRAQIVATADPKVRLRGLYGEVRNSRFETVMERGTGQFTMRSSIGGVDVGELQIGRTRQGFKIGWQGRDLSHSQALARRMSVADDPAAVLLGDPAVESVFETGTGYHVKLRGSRQWVRFTSGHDEATTLTEGAYARISEAGEKGRTIDVGFAEKFNPSQHIQGEGCVLVEAPPKPGQAGFVRLGARGPPPNARLVRVESVAGEVPAYVDPSGSRYIRYADLPDGLKGNADSLAGFGGPLPDPHTTRLVRALGEGQYSSVAREIAADPKVYRSRLDAHLRRELMRNDQLLAAERFDAAALQVNELISIHGRSPDLLARKGLAELSAGRPQRAVATFEQTATRPLRDGDAFFQEVNRRIRSRSTSAVEGENLDSYVRWVDWQSVRPSIQVEGELRPVVSEGRISLELQTDKLPTGTATDARALAQDPNVPVYIQDGLGISNLDWSPSVQQSLHQLISANRIALRQVEMVPLAHFRPATVVESASNSTLRLVKQASLSTGPRAYRSFQSSSCEDDEEWCNRTGRVYVITAPDH